MFAIDATIKYPTWNIGKFLGNGASARVYRVTRDGVEAALKVFDAEIFSGDEEAQERLKRQAELVAKHHENLADTLEVGSATVNDRDSPAILMEFCLGDSLEKPEIQATLSQEDIRTIIASISSAAKFLLDEGYAHRDIKPANVMFSSEEHSTKLLDTGVIRPLSDHNDVSGYAFVGTKRYSPPEFLYRQEDGSVECWTAITFYQIGATLYELIFKRAPYAQYKVKAQLIAAIANEDPDFSGIEDLPSDIRHLLLCSLKRDWKTRLSTLSWRDFLEIETYKDELKLIDADVFSKLQIPAGKETIDQLDGRDKLLAQLGECIRERLLAESFVVTVHKGKELLKISAGRSVKNFTAVREIQLHNSDGGSYVGTITDPRKSTSSERFLFSQGDSNALIEEVCRRLAGEL